MIRVLFVGDGPRDAACLPAIIRTLIETDPGSPFRAWRHIRVGGYDRKLLFAIRAARDEKLDGVVAVVDSDKEKPRERLRKLQAGRDKDRVRFASLPTGLGEARPHVEAWLLDDATAVREALQLSTKAMVPTIRQAKGNPKRVLCELISNSVSMSTAKSEEASFLPFLERIACRIDSRRCGHGKETGFEEFLNDLRREFRSLSLESRG